jgi:hypothetical protein
MAACRQCGTENEPRAEVCTKCDAPLVVTAAAVSDESPHQSFARRLIDAPSPGAESKATTTSRPAPKDAGPAAAAPKPESIRDEPSAAQKSPARPTATIREVESLDRALDSLRRQMTTAFVTSLLVYGTFLVVMLFAAFAFLLALATGAEPTVLGASAGVALAALLGFVAAQLSPLSRRQQRLAVLVAQTEGARSAMKHNQQLWDAYLEARGSRLKAEEIAIAVRSLSLSSQAILADLALGRDSGASSRISAPPLPKDNGAVNPAVAAKY